MAVKKKHNPKSEAAQRVTLRNREKYEWDLSIDDNRVMAHDSNGMLAAVFDLRDCYRKRKPLKGIGKAMSKLVRTRR
jgi:hypothetical protein